MSMTEQGIRASARGEVRSVKPESAPVDPIAEFNQRFDFHFSTKVEDHDADHRQMMVDYAREFGAPELSGRLARLFNEPTGPVATGFGLPTAVLDCLESKFGH